MNNSVTKKIVLICLMCAFSIGLVISVLSANLYTNTKERNSYIEVGCRIAYVPPTARFVKVNGQIKRIVRFASALSKEERDCQCPNCCKGSCYVIIFSDSVPSGNLVFPLAIVWVSCT